MVNENNELLIAKSLGWLAEEDKDIFQDSSNENTRDFLDSIGDRQFFLTIVTDNGRIYQQSLRVRIGLDEMVIEKPELCDDYVKSMHIFFPKIENKWNFFSGSVTACSADSIKVKIPDLVFFLQKRGHSRFLVPMGTKAFFKEDGAYAIDVVQVQDISAGGMLICQRFSGVKYPVNSLINKIYISIPPIIEHGELSSSHKISPLIRQGKIVHSCFKQEFNSSFYGVSFLYQSSHTKKIVTDFVEVLKHRF